MHFVCICMKCTFLAHWPAFLFGPRVFPHPHGASLGSGQAPWRACYGRSKSLELASNHGNAFRLAEPRRTVETPQCTFLSAAAVSCLDHDVPHALKLPTWRQPRHNSNRISSSSPFAAATDGSSMRLRVCACFLLTLGIGTNASSGERCN